MVVIMWNYAGMNWFVWISKGYRFMRCEIGTMEQVCYLSDSELKNNENIYQMEKQEE